MNEVNLTLTQDAFDRFHKAADSRRKQVKVETQDLAQLLMDHSIALRALRLAGVKVIEPPRRNRPKLTAHAADLS